MPLTTTKLTAIPDTTQAVTFTVGSFQVSADGTIQVGCIAIDSSKVVPVDPANPRPRPGDDGVVKQWTITIPAAEGMAIGAAKIADGATVYEAIKTALYTYLIATGVFPHGVVD
jgi:hypothetical protein